MASYCVSQGMSYTKVIQLKLGQRIPGELKTYLEVFGSITTGI
ncbi:hypothetical protein [Nostoc commune]|nr:hypothetical protein [Nostoc commune]